jgi:hypothetical protein
VNSIERQLRDAKIEIRLSDFEDKGHGDNDQKRYKPSAAQKVNFPHYNDQ